MSITETTHLSPRVPHIEDSPLLIPFYPRLTPHRPRHLSGVSRQHFIYQPNITHSPNYSTHPIIQTPRFQPAKPQARISVTPPSSLLHHKPLLLTCPSSTPRNHTTNVTTIPRGHPSSGINTSRTPSPLASLPPFPFTQPQTPTPTITTMRRVR